MSVSKARSSGRFVVLDGLHLDRTVYASVEHWARHHGLEVQDAIQFALCLLVDEALPRPGPASCPPSPLRRTGTSELD